MWNNCKKGTQNAAVKIIRHITKHELERITIEEGYRIYAENNTTQADLSQEYCKQVVSKVKKFSDWRNSRNLHYMDEVDNSVARQYSIFLWEKNIAPSVHDGHIKALSKFFQDIDSLKTLPNRNPFNVANVKRKKHGYRTEASHKAFSPFMIAQVLKSAANAGQDWLDLFILGLNTGMRLKDAALFEWQQIDGKFVEYYPYKTKRFQNRARVGISPALQEMLERRVKSADMNSPYLFPEIAQYYFSKSIKDYLTEIFENALGKNIVRCKAGNHRIKIQAYMAFIPFAPHSQQPWQDSRSIIVMQ